MSTNCCRQAGDLRRSLTASTDAIPSVAFSIWKGWVAVGKRWGWWWGWGGWVWGWGGKEESSQMNLEKSSLIQRWSGWRQSTVNRQTVRLSDCPNVTDQCIHITYVPMPQSQPITFSHTETETESMRERERERERQRCGADSCLSGNVYFLPSAHPDGPAACAVLLGFTQNPFNNLILPQ